MTAVIRMMRFLRRFRRASGEYLLSGAGAEFAAVSEAEEDAISSAILFSWEVFLHALLASTQGANEGNFREIIAVQTGDVLLVRAGNRLLRLHDLYRVSNAGGEAVARLCERLIGQIDVAACNLHLLCGRLEDEQRCAHVGLDLRSQVVEPLAALFEPCIGLPNITVNPVPSEDRDGKRPAHIVYLRCV